MADVENRLTSLEQRCKSNGHRLERLEKQQEAIHALAAGIQVMAAEQKHQTEAIHTVREDVSRLDGKVDALERKPGKRWESMEEKILLAIVAAVVGFILAQIGL